MIIVERQVIFFDYISNILNIFYCSLNCIKERIKFISYYNIFNNYTILIIFSLKISLIITYFNQILTKSFNYDYRYPKNTQTCEFFNIDFPSKQKRLAKSSFEKRTILTNKLSIQYRIGNIQIISSTHSIF